VYNLSFHDHIQLLSDLLVVEQGNRSSRSLSFCFYWAISFPQANQARDRVVTTALKTDEVLELLHFYFSLMYLVLSPTLVVLEILE
jgi:hypothetical protein